MKTLFFFLSFFLTLVYQVFSQKNKALEQVNTEAFSEFAPTVSADGKLLVFESNKGNKNSYKLYESRADEKGNWLTPRYLEEINDAGNLNDWLAGPFLSYDGNYLYYTSSNSKGFGHVDIWYSKRLGDAWGAPQNIGKPINTSGYEGFPSLSPDAKSLYFTAKERWEGSTNCYKIMVAQRTSDSTWSEPVELPAAINTGCVRSPRIMPDNRTLVFSAIRPQGKGGFDLYRSELQEDGSWSEAENLDFVNTADDDELVSVPASGDWLYFTSGKDNLTDLYITKLKKRIFRAQNAVIKGIVKDQKTGKPLAANMLITDADNGKIIAKLQNNGTDGSYMAVLTGGKRYDVAVSKEGYSFYSQLFDLKELLYYQEIEKDIQLSPLAAGVAFVLNNILFDFESAKIRQDALPELKRVVELLQAQPKMTVEIAAHTDNVGTPTYNLQLSQKRAAAIVDFLTAKGINKKRLTSKGYGETKPKMPNNSPANQAQNRRVEFKIIKY